MQPNELPFLLDISEREIANKSESYHLVQVKERTMEEVRISAFGCVNWFYHFILCLFGRLCNFLLETNTKSQKSKSFGLDRLRPVPEVFFCLTVVAAWHFTKIGPIKFQD